MKIFLSALRKPFAEYFVSQGLTHFKWNLMSYYGLKRDEADYIKAHSDEVMIDNNFMATDIGLVPEDKFLTSADFMVTLMTCPYCGASYEVYDTPEEEQENYPYFKEENAKASVV